MLLSACLCAQVQAQSAALEKGDKQYELNNFEGAVQSYTKVLKNLPDNEVVQTKLGDAYRKLGKYDDAVQWYEKATQKGNEIGVLKLGKLYMFKGEYKKAKQTFAKIAATNKEAAHFMESCDFAIATPPISNYAASNATALNTQFDDFLPSITAKGEFVYLSTRNDMQRKQSKTPVGANQLMATTYANGSFTKPVFFNTDLKNNYNEGPITQNNGMAVITQNNFIGGIKPFETKGLELSMKKATIDATGHWQNSQSLNLGGEGYANGMAALSEDGQFLVFVSDRPGGQGGFDLWSCKKVGDGWGVPINLGEVNTPGNEITPFLNGNNLFFASDYHTGLGGYDIFRAESTNGIYNDIYHLGNQVNSPADDYGFVFDESRGIGMLTSNRAGSKGGEDLYFVTKTTKNVVLVCKDEAGKPISGAKVDLSKCDDTVGNTDANGKYTFQFLGEIECAATISKDGYLPTNKMIMSAEGGNNNTIKLEVELKKAPPTYYGFVVDDEGKAIENVLVRATNTTNQKQIEVYSDDKGKFQLPLEAKNNYLLFFSKAKFVNLNINRKDLSANDLALGNIKLKAVAEEYAAASKPAKVTTKGTTEKPKYTIQVAAVKGKPIDIAPYQSALKHIGEVFTSENDGVYRVKVGKFYTKEEALVAQAKVKAAGYESVVTLGATEQKSVYDKLRRPIEIDERTNPTTNTATSKTTTYSNYHVRLETLSKPENFDASKVEKFGKVTTVKNGNLTIFLLSNFASLEDARQAKKQAQSAGFTGAYIVEKQGDKLNKVE